MSTEVEPMHYKIGVEMEMEALPMKLGPAAGAMERSKHLPDHMDGHTLPQWENEPGIDKRVQSLAWKDYRILLLELIIRTAESRRLEWSRYAAQVYAD